MRRIGIPAVVVLCLLLAAAGGAPGDTPGDLLFQAVRANDLQYLKAQLAKSADPNTRGRRDMTLLMYAAAFGSPEAVQLLLDSGADVNAKNSLDATALIWAAADSQKPRLLLDRGADVNARTKLGRTPLMIAAACDGCADNVRLLLAKGADAKATDVVGNTPLSLAAAAGDVEIMRLLVAQGAAADSATNGGLTPLMSAIANCNLAAVQLLLSRGARVNSALTDAGKVKFGPIALVGVTPLMTAAPYCQADVVRALLDAGADVKARDIRNMTPLMLAVASETQDVAVVRLLLQAGADVNVKSKAGETARDWAGKYGNRDVIAALVGQVTDRPTDPPLEFSDVRHPAAATGVRATPVGPAVSPVKRLRAAPGQVTDQSSAGYSPDTRPPALRASIQRATALLERTAAEFFKQSGCVGCHHQPMTLLAVAATRSAGVSVDEPASQELVRMIESDLTGSQETLLQRFDPGGLADGEGYVLQALAAARYPAGAITDTVTRHIAALQHRQGNWHVGDASRSPIQESDIARTARSLRALQLYGPPALKPEFEKRIARARDWLEDAKPATNDDRAMQLVGLYWAGSGLDKLRSLGRDLINTQGADAGWSQNPNLASDPFATGESLWALRESGLLNPSDPVYQHGVKYLLNTQAEDGSWHVRSRAPKFQPYFQSGFPYEHDQWVSSAATAWAVMALAPALEKR